MSLFEVPEIFQTTILWKNFITKKRHWLLTICEVAIPITSFLLISYARSKLPDLGNHYINQSTTVDPISAEDVYTRLNIRDLSVMYAPKTDFTKKLLRKVQLKLSLYNEGVEGFGSENELVDHYNKYGDENGATVVILFSKVGNSMPTKLSYNIKMYEEHVFWNTDKLFGQLAEYVPGSGSETYMDKGFLPIQTALDRSFFEMAVKDDTTLTMTFQEFPYPPYVLNSGSKTMFVDVLPVLTVFSFLFLWPAILKRVIEEKRSGIKELMKLNGLQSWMLWASWFLNGFLLYAVSVVVIVLLLKLKLWGSYPAIQYCDILVLGLFLMLYCSANIAFCLVFSTLFNKPNVAMLVGILFWIISYLGYSNIVDRIDVLPWCAKLPFLILPNIALHYGYAAISKFELREISLNFANVFTSPTGSSNDLSMGNILLTLLLHCVVFYIFAVYLDKIHPGPYGIAKIWHRPLTSMCRKFRFNRTANTDFYFSVNNKIYHIVPKIKIRNLKKTYGHKTAVNDLYLTIYKGEITCLLGHNGAGKTTTLSMLTGMISASSGKILVYDEENNELNLAEDYNSVRHLLSFCPQHNLMFPDLTVLEHLMFFGKLRGMSSEDARATAKSLLRDKLRLFDKKDQLVRKLSGGMKRKLAFGMALMGDPEIIILDEPAAGIDIEGRRELWDLILSYKKSKTILITTHFMDEVEVLADRIAIMDHGNLICYGTPMDLRTAYDVGYCLTVNYSNKDDDEARDAVEKIIKNNVDLQHVANHGFTVKYHLPNDRKGSFGKLLLDLENEKTLREASFSFTLSNTTFEDVYLKVGSMTKETDSPKLSDRILNKGNTSVTELRDVASWLQKFRTLWRKRLLFFKKTIGLWLFMLLISVCVVVLVFLLGGTGMADTTQDGPTLKLDLRTYGETGVHYSTSNTEIDNHYKELIQHRHSFPFKVEDVGGTIIRKGIENIEYYKQRMIVGAEFTSANGMEHVNVMYSNKALHGAAISFNMAMNAVLKAFAGKDYSIVASNTPLHSMVSKHTKLEQTGVTNIMVWFALFPLAPLFIIAYIISFIHVEETSGIRSLQQICGVSPFLYWLVNLLFDSFYYLVSMSIILLSLCLLLNFWIVNMYGWLEYGAIGFILLVYACSMPWVYLASCCMRTVESAYSFYLLLNISIFPVMTVCVLVLEMSGNEYYEDLSIILRYVFAAFPQFTLTYMSSKFSRKLTQNHNWDAKTEIERKQLCSYDKLPCCNPDSVQCIRQRSYFTDLQYLWVTFSTACCLMVVVTYGKSIYFKLRPLLVKFCECCSGDYPSENISQQISQKETSTVIKAMNITQKYLTSLNLWARNSWKEVVRDITFQVSKGQCFGLLGVNGAGKSTTFRMLACQENKITGELSNTAQDDMGYCPQHDALIGELTGRELLETFATLRGEKLVTECVNDWFTDLEMLDYIDQPCGTYSGGNKRKLNTCLALIGLPSLIILDEPTSGVDPTSRRILWDVLSKIKATKKSAMILSSHSMDECEALCDNLIIMKAGKIDEEGTLQELKKKRTGFTIKIKLKNNCTEPLTNPYSLDDVDECKKSKTTKTKRTQTEEIPLLELNQETTKLHNDLVETFNNFEIIDEHQQLLHGRVQYATWSILFTSMEELKGRRSDIEDYSISETSLEDLFLNVAKKQSDADKKK